MIKNHGILNGSSSALAAMTMAYASVGFLLARREVIRLTPTGPEPSSGYIWRRVFLKETKRRSR